MPSAPRHPTHQSQPAQRNQTDAATPDPVADARPFASVLIANRGEIAVRVIIACQELGVRAIAVYSDADRDAPHVRLADAAYRIGPPPARESYLNIPAIIAAAQASGAQAIHPGYGFLSENAAFAEACADAGIVFIGPPPDAIRLMGSKTAAKRAVEAVGVPTVPGYMGSATGAKGDQRDIRALQREAARVGYRIMLKAAAGGGGMGMRVVNRADDFAEALAAAQREALAAFGDETVFFEKLIVAPRHVEFQILADAHGHAIHLGERECSIQRRHQKVLEESPCVALTPELRAAMGADAVRAALAAGYVNAGTCEFLLADDGSYYFLEMNTRLQVEHPITELVSGHDLVHWQLAIAAGRPLTIEQSAITPRGHAIETRLYAEDPARGYLPSSGRLLVFAPPRAPGVRVDAGVSAGDEIGVNYDPMLAKLIVHADDRAAAIARLRWALDHFAVLGVATNNALLRAIADDADFQAGRTNTAFLETHDLGLGERRNAEDGATAEHTADGAPDEVLLAAALWEAQATTSGATTTTSGPFNPWSRAQASPGAALRYRYHDAVRQRVVTLRPIAGERGAYDAWLAPTPGPSPVVAGEGSVWGDGVASGVASGDGAGQAVQVRASVAALGEVGQAAVTLVVGGVALGSGGGRATLYVARRGYDVLVWRRGRSYSLAKPRPLDVETAVRGGEVTSGAQTLLAPMAGTIVKVNVAPGDVVATLQTLVVLGAMKMEHAIVAPHAARVRRVGHAAGDVVPGGEMLVELVELEAMAE